MVASDSDKFFTSHYKGNPAIPARLEVVDVDAPIGHRRRDATQRECAT